MLRTRSARWIAIAGVYGLALALLLVLIAAEDDASARTKAIEAAVFVAVPAVVFALAAAPLWRESRNRLWLAGAAILSFLAAIVLVVVTWGVALPVGCGLVAVAIADLDRVLTLSGFRGTARTLTFAVVLVIGGGLVGLATPIALLLALAAVAILVWKLVTTRPRRTADGS
jgi:hypothetical protein